MPTVIIVDNSLSMGRLVGKKEREYKPSTPKSPQETITIDDDVELRHLAIQGISFLLDQIETNCRLEHVALLQFSSLCELTVPFTRDIDQVRSKLSTISCQDKSLLEVGLQGVSGLIMDEWGASVTVNLVIVTDGSLGHGPHSLQNLISVGPVELKLPLPFPCAVSVVCLADKTLNKEIKKVKTAYENLFTKLGVPTEMGSFHQIDGVLNHKSTEQVFKEVSDLHYKQWCGKLELGVDMVTRVQLCPPPKNFSKVRDFEVVKRELTEVLVVKGFLALSEISSPPVYSRHLMLPTLPSNLSKDSKEDDSKTPNLCVFLHGALKVENMCCVVEVGEDWYGVLYSWSDNKKKSSLMLSLFEPGLDSVPWMGSLDRLGPASGLNETTQSPFPVRSDRKPSYSSGPVVWIKQSGIQSDIQKVLRHARKLPEKTMQFYKELNRLKRAAVCLGFYELLEGVAQICDRECTLLPANVSPDCAIQLTYVASVLRSPECYNVKHVITPKLTHFNQGKI